ncbi:MAG TPA: hypothetical protein VN887_01595 [Candidatus Angelobacter sp.]|nr:hypothetical protein [Candidatus Angelobacter sp.]
MKSVVFAILALACAVARGADKTNAPPFEIRGTLPWHNFLSGPTAWNESDYRAYLDLLATNGLNFVGFHCYTGGGERYVSYVEPIIRVQYRDVLPEAAFDTSLTSRWGYRPLAVKDFVFGTDKPFKLPAGAEAFGADNAVTAHTKEERYRNAHDLMRKVIAMAHARGIQVAIGFEFGVHPPELASVVPSDSRIPGALIPDPTHPANIEILHSELDDILHEYPGVDWIWLWLHEHSMYVAPPSLNGRFAEFVQQERTNFDYVTNWKDAFIGLWSLVQIRQAHDYLAVHSPRTRLVIGGWGGNLQLPPILRGLDRALPTNIVFSCLNPNMGREGNESALAEIASHRPVWAIPWFEGDSALWHLQLRAASVSAQVKAAYKDKFAGIVGIHWRTEEILPNLEAFAITARDPEHAPSAEELYRLHCVRRYGEASGEVAPLLLRLEQDGQLGNVRSAEYYPYDPGWGRVSPELTEKLTNAIDLVQRLESSLPATSPHRTNLDWLADNFRFTLLLDTVGRKMESAYVLKYKSFLGTTHAGALKTDARAARKQLDAAPMKELFQTFARRVRSRGELGELSSLNQKVWTEFRELDQFLTAAGAPAK